MWVARESLPVASLVHLLHATCILRWDLAPGWSVADGGKVRANARRIVLACRSLRGFGGLAVNGAATLSGALAFLFGLPLAIFLLLAGLPLLSDLFEFCSRTIVSFTLN